MSLLALLGLLTGLALAPALVYILVIWALDRYEKEPISLAVLAFVWGAIPAILLALVFEVLLGIPLEGAGAVGEFGQASLIAPIVEEGAKGIILFVLFLAYRHEFDDVMDGILYGALVGLGFSVVENIVYGFRFAYPDGYHPGLAPALDSVIFGWFLRSGIFGLNHAFFTSITGATLGYIRSTPRLRATWGLPVLGLGGAMFFHGLHNSLAGLGVFGGESVACVGCLIDVLADWSGVLIVLVIALLAGAKERRWIEQHLWEEVAVGRFSQAEYYMLISARRRWGARWTALTRYGWTPFRQLGRLQQLATELAFRKQQVLIDHDSTWRQRDIQVLRARIDDLHTRMAGGGLARPV
ncbi:MAG TPA: PrsW family intramembrane metalloprotease [Chloroflexia bacterium]|nr:PrsW family intramembrane metalloprotease [Chloroflexia bacterium]